MTRADAGRLVGIVITAYPNSDKYRDKEAVTNAVNLWADFFADDDERIVALAVKKHISTSKWPPAIAEIREIMTEIRRPDLIPPDEAWTLVSRYMDVSGEYDGGERLERVFPAPIIRALNAVGYRALRDLRIRRYDRGAKQAGLDRLAFTQAYEPEYERERKKAAMPPKLRQAIDMTQRAARGDERGQYERASARIADKERERRDFYDRLERGRLTAAKQPALLEAEREGGK
jgi:hypothetical protein